MTGRMKFTVEVFFCFVIVLFFALFVYQATGWRLQARLYPWTIGIPMILLGLIQLVRDLKGTSNPKSASAPVDYQFSQPSDKAVARSRTVKIFSWIFGFFAGIWLLGFPFAVPLFVFCYLKFEAREGWGISTVLTGIAWLLFWGLFYRLLRLPFPEGEIFTWMGR
ncbi:MAG: tripartite tricarboxylate transporter TctB family protein [Candidatus Binatia bacterium]